MKKGVERGGEERRGEVKGERRVKREERGSGEERREERKVMLCDWMNVLICE